MSDEHKIEFRIIGFGKVWIEAKSKSDVVEQFNEMDIKELAGWCEFSDFDLPSSIHIISIDEEEFQADLDEVRAELREEAATC